eukprot:TRINITY_DN22746_c2_g3_i1.p1 TRINITY_DN22746_c2_g3~~TRINITY_DN22746_c2_g3_i1.p1  ORF type:complete len:235 (-),score=-24.02 TRINITY_DN22746_c2_g3_i1:105-809(-)
MSVSKQRIICSTYNKTSSHNLPIKQLPASCKQRLLFRKLYYLLYYFLPFIYFIYCVLFFYLLSIYFIYQQYQFQYIIYKYIVIYIYSLFQFIIYKLKYYICIILVYILLRINQNIILKLLVSMRSNLTQISREIDSKESIINIPLTQTKNSKYISFSNFILVQFKKQPTSQKRLQKTVTKEQALFKSLLLYQVKKLLAINKNLISEALPLLQQNENVPILYSHVCKTIYEIRIL